MNKLLRSLKKSDDPNFIGFDKYKSKGAYHWKEINANQYYRNKVEIIERYIENKSARVMDIGCGDGAYMYFLSKSCKEIYGIDADFDAVRLAKSKFHEFDAGNCFCLQAPISKIDSSLVGGECSFDLIYSMDVIEHLPRPSEIFEVGKKFIRPKGKLVIGTPLFISKELISPYHVTEYTVEEIRNILCTNGELIEEHVVPMERKDGRVYEQGFYIGALSLRN